MMRCQERPSAKHAGLHFVGNEESAVAPAQFLRTLQVGLLGDVYPAFRLNRFHKKCGVTLGREQFLQRLKIAERHEGSFRKKRTESFSPVLTVHQVESAVRQAGKCKLESSLPELIRIRSGKLDCRFHA